MIFLLGILTDAFFIALLTWCACTDIWKRIIPNLAIVLLLCLGGVHLALAAMNSGAWWPYPAGLLLSIPFFIAWLKSGMGGGDVKLVVAIGFYLGLWCTFLAFALMLPVFAVLYVILKCRHQTTKHRIPLAPVIAIGSVGVVVAGYLCRHVVF